MLITPAPIFVEDIIAEGTADFPVGVECSARGRTDMPLAHGWIRAQSVQPGFEIHAADYAAYEDYTVLASAHPGLFVGMNLGTDQIGQAGTRSYELRTNELVMVSVREPVMTREHRAASTQQTRCGIMIQDDWFEAGYLDEFEISKLHLHELLHSHVKPWQTTASPAIIHIARRMTASMNAAGSLAGLRRETVGLELLLEILALLNLDRHKETRSSNRELGRVKQIRDVLDGLDSQSEIVLADLAKLANMSVRSLSRHFRSAFGTTIFAYVAEIRMERARQALKRQGASLDFAAYLAGYAHTSNFVTAYRRRYGCTPGSVASSANKKRGRFE